MSLIRQHIINGSAWGVYGGVATFFAGVGCLAAGLVVPPLAVLAVPMIGAGIGTMLPAAAVHAVASKLGADATDTGAAKPPTK